jgi:hypothetical protein
VEIVAWDKPEVSIEAEIRGKTADDLQRIRVEFETDATHVAVKIKLEKKPGLFWGASPRGEVRYHLRVPAGVSLKKSPRPIRRSRSRASAAKSPPARSTGASASRRSGIPRQSRSGPEPQNGWRPPARIFHTRMGLRLCLTLGVSVSLPLP